MEIIKIDTTKIKTELDAKKLLPYVMIVGIVNGLPAGRHRDESMKKVHNLLQYECVDYWAYEEALE